ncbi:UDP-glucuronosyltransferase 1A4-like [Physella acuta]|uniref:UDP-glucuronosyltransferase 1A4-like n=1 Tax=Physella acuta TaxID=109671 RepID=UPI0027DB123B|nr:UDP-glucuronosyltransferase 1A4-like [Physella acuta]
MAMFNDGRLKILAVLAVTLQVLVHTEAKVAVLFSVPHLANVRTHTNVGRALAEMGHDVYVCVPQFMLDGNLINVDGVKVIAYGDYLGNIEEEVFSKVAELFWLGQDPSVFFLSKLVPEMQGMVRRFLSDQDLLTRLKSVQPDLFLISKFPPFINIVILPYMLGVPFAFLTPFSDLSDARVPFSPSSTACQLSDTFSDQGMSFVDRFKTAVCNLFLALVLPQLGDGDMVAEFASNRPKVSVQELILMAEVYLVENDHVMDFAKPALPNTIRIGGTAATDARPLKEPFKKFLDGSKNGVAVVTFGSTVLNIPEPVIKKMTSAFLKQKLDVVWRVNTTSPNADRMLTSTWVPQNDILAHKNTKLFVSHCGANGQYEALYHGVPMICVPLFGDQFYNAQRSKSKGYGLTANILDITDHELADLMKEVSENEKYRSNIKKASALYRLLYKSPDKTAAFWMDHVMQYGGSYMKSAGQQMPLYQYLSLDVLAVLFAILALAVLIVFKICRCCCRVARKCLPTSKRSQKKKKE